MNEKQVQLFEEERKLYDAYIHARRTARSITKERAAREAWHRALTRMKNAGVTTELLRAHLRGDAKTSTRRRAK